MKSSRKICGALATLFLTAGASAQVDLGFDPTSRVKLLPPNEALLARIPADLREASAASLRIGESAQRGWQRLPDGMLRQRVLTNLAREPRADDLVLTLLPREGPETKIALLTVIENNDHWLANAKVDDVLANLVKTDPNLDVMVLAADALRKHAAGQIRKVLIDRIAAARAAGDSAALDKLGLEEQRWFTLAQGITLPSFLNSPPALFSVVPEDRAIRVLAFGDFGTGSESQKQTAAAMRSYHRDHPFDFGLTLGDNFYVRGLSTPQDPRWRTQWEELYSPMGIKFYATMGNHDWVSSDSPAAEILYSAQSPDWRMPAPYYTFTAGSVQFFAFDTVEVNEAELIWLDEQLSRSRSPWKVVYGHYHIFSATRGDNQVLIARLLPVLEKNHVDVYLNGHDHNLQELKPEGGVHFFVSGGGGAGLYNLNPYDRSIYKDKVNGFTVIDADREHFKLSFIGTDDQVLHETTLARSP